MKRLEFRKYLVEDLKAKWLFPVKNSQKFIDWRIEYQELKRDQMVVDDPEPDSDHVSEE